MEKNNMMDVYLKRLKKTKNQKKKILKILHHKKKYYNQH